MATKKIEIQRFESGDTLSYFKYQGMDTETGEVLFITRSLNYAKTRAKMLGYKSWEINVIK